MNKYLKNTETKDNSTDRVMSWDLQHQSSVIRRHGSQTKAWCWLKTDILSILSGVKLYNLDSWINILTKNVFNNIMTNKLSSQKQIKHLFYSVNLFTFVCFAEISHD